jgi:prepilin-type N-terminal cleavage/methylation domain-containing protein
MLRKLNKNRKGFTIIELIVVMAILAILVALAVPRYLGYTKDAEVTAMASDSKVIEQASYQYALKNDDQWPVGQEVTTLDATVQGIIDKALTAKGATAQANDLLTANAFKQIDATKINPFIRSTKNPISEYFIVDRVSGVTGYNNELEGMVFSVKALPDSNGVNHSGLFDDKE